LRFSGQGHSSQHGSQMRCPQWPPQASLILVLSMANDWFRKKTWSDADRADFFLRLKRSRGCGKKAQCLRIQALHLQDVGSPELLTVAISLLDKMIEEFPEKTQLASAYFQKAECLAALGDIDQTVTFYRLALDTEQSFPFAKTQAWLNFGRFVVDRNLPQFFAEALKILLEHEEEAKFPIEMYQLFGIRAIIACHDGDFQTAKTLAMKALKAGSAQNSGLRYHLTVGLVKNTQTNFHRRLQQCVEARRLN